jgi:1,4-alpha-glucan branching enzyme
MPPTKPAVPARRIKPGAKRIPFTVKVAEAREVALAGDFNGWAPATPLKRFEDGAWTVILELLPGEYQYRLVVDGQWRDHAEAQRRVPNPFGTENCVLTVA